MRAWRGDESVQPPMPPTSGPHSGASAEPPLATRRLLLLSAASALAIGSASSSSSGASESEKEYISSSQGYHFRYPAAWEQTSKAGADVLIENPGRKSTTVGVTVLPVRIASLDKFGDVALVGERLLGAERAKESTKSVTMLHQSSRQSASGLLLYDFEYELDSTRGRKRILSTVAVVNKKLYILNGNYKCEESVCRESEVEPLRISAASFDALPV
ncbi:hypothetical protein WJX72_001487 [[Myrmecia] bisecta]|uniref:PsbP C-terminal domain-containing protein n=1 Tax=[Myrmecia] bisecta TaxID=41462 RepID=A0AAW1R4J0_9CHLO